MEVFPVKLLSLRSLSRPRLQAHEGLPAFRRRPRGVMAAALAKRVPRASLGHVRAAASLLSASAGSASPPGTFLLAPPASIRPLLPRKVAVGLCSRYKSASAVPQVHGAVGDSWGYSRGVGRSPPRWLRVSISQFFPVAFVSLLVLASVSANDLATPGGYSDTFIFRVSVGRGSRTPTGFSAPVSRARKPEMRGARGPRPEASRGEDPPPAPVPLAASSS